MLEKRSGNLEKYKALMVETKNAMARNTEQKDHNDAVTVTETTELSLRVCVIRNENDMDDMV